MAGANKMLKAGQVVFKAGDPADGMYLVRKGELVVYLEQNGKEVVLAKIGEGGMIGEMALFDRQPRSASVKAGQDTEITLISLDDFGKLMKQIPKWFVGLMSALSGRLRSTNDRLKQIESAGGSSAGKSAAGDNSIPYRNLLRILHVMELTWHRDGTKEGKEWCLQRKTIEESLINTFGEKPEKIAAVIDLLIQEQILISKVDTRKNVVLALVNRAALRQFADFMSEFTRANPTLRSVPDAMMNILKVLQKMAAKAPYEQFTVTQEELLEEGVASGFKPADWPPVIKNFTSFGESVKVVKATGKSAIGLRVTKAEFPGFLRNLNAFIRASQAGLDS